MASSSVTVGCVTASNGPLLFVTFDLGSRSFVRGAIFKDIENHKYSSRYETAWPLRPLRNG